MALVRSSNSFDPLAFPVESAIVTLAAGSSVPEEAASIAAVVTTILDRVVAVTAWGSFLQTFSEQPIC